MEREQGGGQGARPLRPRHPPQQEKEQDGIGQMQEQAGEMMAGGIQSVELEIHHVRNPGQRVPVAGAEGRKSPNNSRPAHPLFDHAVGSDIIAIVQRHKVTIPDLSISRQNGQGQPPDR